MKSTITTTINNTAVILEIKEKLGPSLFDLALAWARGEARETKGAKIAAITSIAERKSIDGSRAAIKLLPHIDDAAKALSNLRLASQRIKRMERIKNMRTARKVVVFKGTPANRLMPTIETNVLKAIRQNLRETAGVLTISVTTTTAPEEVGMIGESYRDWNDKYGGGHYAKIATRYSAVVPHNYLSRVVKRGLTVVDGVITLDAQRMDCRESGIEVYAAIWVQQSKGVTVKVVKGFIARTTNRRHAFHGASYSSALTGLRQKVRIANESPEEASKRAEKHINAFVRRYAGGNYGVTVNDAYETGSCAYGVESWCHANGLPFEVGHAPLADVLAAYKRMPLPEARRAIIHAHNRNRQAIAA